MANAKQVLDVRVSKGVTTAQSNEHMRRWTEKGWNRAVEIGNYDPTREHLNFEIAPGGKIRTIDKSRSIPERIADILSDRGIKVPHCCKYYLRRFKGTDARTRIRYTTGGL